MDEVRIVTIQPEHFAALEELQRICYPTLGTQELMCAEHFAAQYRVFAEGQFVALAGEQVVGQGSGFWIDFDFDHPQHSFKEICAGFFFTNHDSNGAWYYGADISVHPGFRRRGIGRLLYQARQALVQRANRRGIVAGGLIPGYAQHKGRMSVGDYVERVASGALADPTLTFQLRNGFRVCGLLENYLEDSASDNWSTLIVWENLHYRVPAQA
ncbi:MAG: GNAT family N-acetyltransferase [Caldilineaceae bacterium]|nr:GNAT family N-acetyltransferase [Caldilineaceae bacterium]